MWLVSVVIYYIVGIICIAGVLSPVYDDNLFQRCGLAFICLAAFSRADYYTHVQWVATDVLVLQIGIFLFAIGTSCKVYIWYLRDKARRFLAWPNVERRRGNRDHVGTTD